jgi:hypothetical protein
MIWGIAGREYRIFGGERLYISAAQVVRPSRRESDMCRFAQLRSAVGIVATLVILSVVLAPGLSALRARSQRTDCLGHMLQVSQAIFVYAAANDGRSIPSTSMGMGSSKYMSWVSDTNHDKAWPELLVGLGYLSDWGLFRCPADPNATDDGLSFDPVTYAVIPSDQVAKRHWAWGWRTDIGYAYMWFNTPLDPVGRTFHNTRFAEVGRPARTILLSDSV